MLALSPPLSLSLARSSWSPPVRRPRTLTTAQACVTSFFGLSCCVLSCQVQCLPPQRRQHSGPLRPPRPFLPLSLLRPRAGLGRHRGRHARLLLVRARSERKALPPQLLPRLRRSVALHLQVRLCCPLWPQGIVALHLPPLGPWWQLVSIRSCRPPLRSLLLVHRGGMVGLCHLLIALVCQVQLWVARVRPPAFGAPELACLFVALLCPCAFPHAPC